MYYSEVTMVKTLNKEEAKCVLNAVQTTHFWPKLPSKSTPPPLFTTASLFPVQAIQIFLKREYECTECPYCKYNFGALNRHKPVASELTAWSISSTCIVIIHRERGMLNQLITVRVSFQCNHYLCYCTYIQATLLSC